MAEAGFPRAEGATLVVDASGLKPVGRPSQNVLPDEVLQCNGDTGFFVNLMLQHPRLRGVLLACRLVLWQQLHQGRRNLWLGLLDNHGKHSGPALARSLRWALMSFGWRVDVRHAAVSWVTSTCQCVDRTGDAGAYCPAVLYQCRVRSAQQRHWWAGTDFEQAQAMHAHQNHLVEQGLWAFLRLWWQIWRHGQARN